MRSRSLLWSLAVGWGCTAAGEDMAPRSGANTTVEATAEANGFVPLWEPGQTWVVDVYSFFPSMNTDPTPELVRDEWRYRVESVSDIGVVSVSIREHSIRENREVYDTYTSRIHRSGFIVESAEPAAEPQFPLPFVPYLPPHQVSAIHVIPCWPRFPIFDGQELSFYDGTLTQSVREVDDVFHIELVTRNRDGGEYPSRHLAMEWERGRPFWSRVEIIRKRDSGADEVPFEHRGEVRTWDETNPWAK
ncbi:MAG: hypothetical protein AAF799_47220 [Myxococcota bacterium]